MGEKWRDAQRVEKQGGARTLSSENIGVKAVTCLRGETSGAAKDGRALLIPEQWVSSGWVA